MLRGKVPAQLKVHIHMANPTHIGWNKRCPIVTPNKMIHRGIWKVQSTRKSIFNSKEHTLMAFRNFRMTPVL